MTLQPLLLVRLLDDEGGTIRMSVPLYLPLLLLGCEGTQLDYRCYAAAAARKVRVDKRCCELRTQQ